MIMPPEIWDRQQVHAVRRCGIQYSVDMEAIVRSGGEVISYTKERMAYELVRAIQEAVVVDAHREDIAFTEAERDEPFNARIIRGRWNPPSCVVSFAGGPSDGVLMEVHRDLLFKPIRIPYERRTTWEIEPDEEFPTSLAGSLQYEWAGWNNTRRHWVYNFAS